MFGDIKISPSILSADFMNFERDIRMLERGGTDFIHVDVMDGHFVPNLTLGVPFVSQLKKITDIPLDVHLMISNPLEQLDWYLKAGADWVSVHMEALHGEGEVREFIQRTREAGVHPALTLKPDYPVEELEPYIAEVDMVLVMSVFPGFSGQSYIEGSEDRVGKVAEMAKRLNPDLLIEVDGGISAGRTAGLVCAQGADVLVAGSGVFKAEDPEAASRHFAQCWGGGSLMDKPVYLDWAATAPLCKEAADAMAPYLQAGIDGLVAGNGNANSLYEVGRTAFRALEQAREDIARSIKARPDEMTFTSGATEADNAALFGIVDAAMARAEQEGDHECVPQIVVSSIEHDAVLKAAETLGHWGAQVTYVEPDSSGHITPDALEEVLTDRVLLVSVMAVNNEVGSVMDIPALAAVAHKAGALFHVDATQAFGKIPVSVKEWGVDALSISSHKIGGPKGMGALYVKARTPFTAQIVGGGQESGRRSGTQNVMAAVGFSAAARAALANLDENAQRLRALRDECYARLLENPKVKAAVSVEPGTTAFAPHVVNVLVRGMESETLILQLDRRGFCVSGGSACSSHSLNPSHVLKAIGVSRDDALGSLRVSLGNTTTAEELDAFIEAFNDVVG